MGQQFLGPISYLSQILTTAPLYYGNCFPIWILLWDHHLVRTQNFVKKYHISPLRHTSTPADYVCGFEIVTTQNINW